LRVIRPEPFTMRRMIALAASLCSVAQAQATPQHWTFCVAATGSGSDVWISEVFRAEGKRESIETAFKSALEKLGATGANAQCPLPREDKMVAVNAQFDAEAFNRKMGAALHAVPPSAFPGQR
jgi:hypothetical protein